MNSTKSPWNYTTVCTLPKNGSHICWYCTTACFYLDKFNARPNTRTGPWIPSSYFMNTWSFVQSIWAVYPWSRDKFPCRGSRSHSWCRPGLIDGARVRILYGTSNTGLTLFHLVNSICVLLSLTIVVQPAFFKWFFLDDWRSQWASLVVSFTLLKRLNFIKIV